MVERIRSNWNARAEAVGETMVKFTIQRDGQIQGVEVEKSSGYTALDINAQRALLVTRQLPPLPGRLSESDADRPPQFSIHKMIRTFLTRRRGRTPHGRRGGTTAAAAAPPPLPPSSAAAERNQHDDQQRRGRAPRRGSPCPTSSRLSSDAETVDAAKTIAQVLWDDLNFEREFALIPRDIYASDPGGDVATRRAVRSLARAERRRHPRRHRAEDRIPACGSRRGCSTCAAASRRSPASTAARWPTRGSTRTPSPTKSTSSSARCAASPAPS